MTKWLPIPVKDSVIPVSHSLIPVSHSLILRASSVIPGVNSLIPLLNSVISGANSLISGNHSMSDGNQRVSIGNQREFLPDSSLTWRRELSVDANERGSLLCLRCLRAFNFFRRRFPCPQRCNAIRTAFPALKRCVFPNLTNRESVTLTLSSPDSVRKGKRF